MFEYLKKVSIYLFIAAKLETARIILPLITVFSIETNIYRGILKVENNLK